MDRLCSRQLRSVVLRLINWIRPRLFDFPSAGSVEPSIPHLREDLTLAFGFGGFCPTKTFIRIVIEFLR
jgi:hypothetical protein